MSLRYYLATVNILVFLLYGWDKHQAAHGGWRISEKTLLAGALLGGGAGALAAMRIFHHKTRKAAFRFGVPVILVIEAAAYMYLKFVR
ncbi:MAG: DUF1294 domain-containing protein [Solobacterium sp.]|nr:DUF1294 domain-containing protein [Solobacterium sp.]